MRALTQGFLFFSYLFVSMTLGTWLWSANLGLGAAVAGFVGAAGLLVAVHVLIATRADRAALRKEIDTVRQAHRLLDDAIAIDCPVRLLQGQCDTDVPWEIALRTADRLRSSDVQALLIKDGDHRLSRDGDIALLIRTVESRRCHPTGRGRCARPPSPHLLS